MMENKEWEWIIFHTSFRVHCALFRTHASHRNTPFEMYVSYEEKCIHKLLKMSIFPYEAIKIM